MTPPRTLTYFISDLHLGAGYIPEPRVHERIAVEFLRSIAPTAKRLYLLGDILDYWWEYRDVVPRGFTRFFGALAELSDSGTEIVWLKGNHDIWIFDYLPAEIGLRVHDGVLRTEIDGKEFLLEHGDGVGRLPLSFRLLRRLFRCRPAQKLFAAIHPRWTVGFAHAWSSRSRKKGGYNVCADDDEPLVEFAEKFNSSAPSKVDYFIFGHRHSPLDTTLADGARVVILGDWITRFNYAIWDGYNLVTKTFVSTAKYNNPAFNFF